MPLDGFYPQGQFDIGVDVGTSTGSSRGTIVTSSATANTKGSFTQLIASTSVDAAAILVQFNTGFTTSSTSSGVDIAIGGAGSEQVIVNNLYVEGGRTNGVAAPGYVVPVAIPAGSRVSARSQSSSTSIQCGVQVTLLPGGVDGAAGVDAYGFNAATTLGTSVDPGGTANTKGAYVQITAGLSTDISGFALNFGGLNQTTSTASQFLLVDIAIGGSGSEKIIVPNFPALKLRNNSVQGYPHGTAYVFPIPIPSGTRIAIRGQGSLNTTTTRLFGIVFYGVRGGTYPPGLELAQGSDVGANTSASTGTTAPTTAANTKGAWTQLTASAPIDAQWLILSGIAEFLSGSMASVDLGIGGAGSEVALVNNYVLESSGNSPTQSVLLPANISAGTRVAIRGQSNFAGADNGLQAMAILSGAMEASPCHSGLVDTYGFDAANTKGTIIDPGGVANTKGAWVEITSSLTNDIAGFWVQFDGGDVPKSGTTNASMLVDIGIGGSGSEQVILPNFTCDRLCNTNMTTVTPISIPYIPMPIPAGTRVAIRAQSSTTTATNRLFGATFYGVRT